MRRVFLLFILLNGLFMMRAVSSDSIRISLLTCAPGTEIYALFGHTAIRYENLSQEQDWVFNYGVFSFDTPNFIYRFVKGETDYQLGVVPYRRFELEYAMRGSSVYQQVLNLDAEEKNRLVHLLEENYLPSNRTYRYNYFYDNCTTRALDKIEECLKGDVVYPVAGENVTFRGIVHEFTDGSEWSELGIDLCLGSEADEPIGGREQMFAPFYLLAAADKAMIHRADTVIPLVKEKKTVVDVQLENEDGWIPSPVVCSLLLMMVAVGMAVWSVKRLKPFWTWDLFLFGVQGIGGCVIAFLFFFSLHPTVGSNWMIVLFNPIPLLYLPIMIYKDVKRKKDCYHWFNIGVLTFFIVMIPFIQQKINLAVLPLLISLLVCSASHLIIYRRMK